MKKKKKLAYNLIAYTLLERSLTERTLAYLRLRFVTPIIDLHACTRSFLGGQQ